MEIPRTETFRKVLEKDPESIVEQLCTENERLRRVLEAPRRHVRHRVGANSQSGAGARQSIIERCLLLALVLIL